MGTKKKLAKKTRSAAAGLVARAEQTTTKNAAAPVAVAADDDDNHSVQAALAKLKETVERLKKKRAEVLAQGEKLHRETLERVTQIDAHLALLGENTAVDHRPKPPEVESDWRTDLVKDVGGEPKADVLPASTRGVRPGGRLDLLIRRFRRHTSFSASDVQKAFDLSATGAFGLIYQGRKQGFVKKLGVEDGTVRWRVIA